MDWSETRTRHLPVSWRRGPPRPHAAADDDIGN